MRVIAGSLMLLLSVFPSVAVFGQAASSSPSGKPSGQEKTVQIMLHPASEARPALKYQLLPPFLERKPGNAAVWWNRLPAERLNFLWEFYYSKNPLWDRIEKWMDIPLGDPKEKEYRKTVLAKDIGALGGGGIFSDMQRAARFESCDWELPIRDGNFITILLPEVQQSRMYARLLSAKAHLEIAEGKYDQAVRTLQVGYAQARDVASGQTIINSLVGVTIAGIMSYQVQQFVQQPDAPNLYWALSTLPRPLVDFRPGGEAESEILYLQFPELYDLDKKQLSPEGWQVLLKKIEDGISKLESYLSTVQETKATVKATPSAKAVYPRAKRYLIERGRTAAEVEAMPMAQVVLLYSVNIYNERSNEQWKWFFLSAAEASTRSQPAGEPHQNAETADFGIFPPLSFWPPAAQAAKEAETRLQWDVAVLRIFEAMRLHAANHHGQWPDHLSDIAEVPIPVNPYDGKPFLYERKNNKAVLTAEKGPKNWHRRYEITLMPNAE